MHNANVISAQVEPKAKNKEMEESLSLTAEEAKILITRWLLSSGLPSTTLSNKALLLMARRLSNQPKLSLPAR
ncbi:hypothetical protein GN958_ATG20995 [Phytophthora infestans]|uniref:Uncharacterized protein n=1 Tax=Phytophthora infestans TaxID=4787 RepID=A0A8S9TSW6_PHYIN|nr:hypothetical protein GN958_ATG20995 [Phytophthora infestans]